MSTPPPPVVPFLERLSLATTRWAGRSSSFACALGLVILALASGPFFHFSNTWQSTINMGTTLVTFLMVFLIQRGQNKDALAVQLKLNEVVAALEGASNRLIGAENLTEQELDVLRGGYGDLSDITRQEAEAAKSHSIEDAGPPVER